MRSIQRILSWLPIALLLLSHSVNAEVVPFDQKTFDSAIKSGAPVVVEFSADWCPTCRAQRPIVQSLLKGESMKALTLFVADFDREEKLKRDLRVSYQSTFVVFKSGKEVGRSTGQTRKEDIEALFKLAL
ncbi:MAG: thioredoxin family protein [Hyphomicrobiaceae bacterium]|nr:thioredoxin family protein [Hyphomicrobiaceae bacterium]